MCIVLLSGNKNITEICDKSVEMSLHSFSIYFTIVYRPILHKVEKD